MELGFGKLGACMRDASGPFPSQPGTRLQDKTRCSAGIGLAGFSVAGTLTGSAHQAWKRLFAMNSQSDILRNRIKFAVRRCTGRVVDMEAMLGRPELRDPRIRAWREIGSAGLNALLDQLESEFQQDTESQHLVPAAPGHKVLKGIQLVPRSPRAQ